ncbi:MAG: alpha/beta hydrolase [Lachnospiraceae bacterium]|nr:alpha/beta hydrolase [Lachnospiraceae bacterium]
MERSTIYMKPISTTNEISQIYTFTLGGMPQKVLIEGKSKELPVIINLHGGPGNPIPFSVGCRGLFPEFTDVFIMVYWDQLGSGINDYKLKDEFTVDSFVDMTADLICEVKKLFPANKLILFGMSWGSVLALRVLKKLEYRSVDKQMTVSVDAVVVWGQVLRNLFLNEEVFASLEKAGLSEKKMQRIRAITPNNFTDKDMQFLSGAIRKYTDGYNNKKGEQAPMGPIIKGLLKSPDYKFKDFKAIMINGTATSTKLWPELLKLDLTEELKAVTVPYHILQGDTDIVTSTTDIVKVVDMLDNPNARCRVVPNSGHMPGKEGMDAVFETLKYTCGAYVKK